MNTATVGMAVTPTVMSTFLSHVCYLIAISVPLSAGPQFSLESQARL
jgi:hypothetical protein